MRRILAHNDPNGSFAGWEVSMFIGMTRVLAGIAWVVISLLLWAIPCNLLYLVIEYSGRHSIHIPAGVDFVLSFVPATGMLIILPLTAVLALRGKLPWTGPKNLRDRDEGTF
jgi:hypothetical protein